MAASKRPAIQFADNVDDPISAGGPSEGAFIDQEKLERDSISENEALSVRESDYRRKQVFKGFALFWLSYQSTGAIYGDIGTSPLYVYSSTFPSEPSYDDVLGVLSLIIWTLTLLVTIKYIFVVLRADDEGEGGTFAMYNLLSRYCNIAAYDPRAIGKVKMERFENSEMQATNLTIRGWIERSHAAHAALKVLAVFGVSLTMAEGILMPAQTVLGAIQGLNVVRPDLGNGAIIGISCAVLVVLFMLQPLGVHRLASCFAPVIILWLVFNLAFGIYNLVVFDHSVLRAFSPYFAGLFFVRNKTDGWKALGGVLLSFTGVEALFADMGAFSRNAVQISWLFFTYPCLLLTYIGQAAYISRHPSAFDNPFFESVPPGMFWPSLIISILAATVASQALITSTFQLLSQLMNTSYFPQVRMVYTSKKYYGQVFVPYANWAMMVGAVIVTAVYSDTTSLGHAYGVCVILVSFITSCMVALIALIVWRLNALLVLAIWVPFISLDGLYLSSALTKVPEGGWFTILLAVLLGSIFVVWRYGKESQWAAERRSMIDLKQLISVDEDGVRWLAGAGQLTRLKGIALYFDKAGERVPIVCEEFLRKFEAQPEISIFLHLRALNVPHVPAEDCYTVARTSLPNYYRVVIRHGYKDTVINADLGTIVYEELRKYIPTAYNQHAATSTSRASAVDIGSIAEQRSVGPSTSPSLSATYGDVSALIADRLDSLDEAYTTQIVYIVGKEELRLLKEKNNFIKRVILNIFLWIRSNTRAKVASMRIPIDKLVEVGFVKEL